MDKNFYVYGKGQRSKSLIPSLINSSQKNIKINILSPNDKCDFIYIDDVIHFFMKLIEKKFESGVYNIGSGTQTKVIDICKKILKKKFYRLCVYNSKSKVINNYYADTKKSKKIIRNYKNISLNNGIKKMLNFNNA